MNSSVIRRKEHEEIDSDELSESIRGWLRDQNKHDKRPAETLGLHMTSKGLAPGDFIGMVWVGEGENRRVLQSNSKFDEMDYIKMFVECSAHSVIGRRMNKCLNFWADEELIDAPIIPDFIILTIAAYLRELNDLCRRHLHRHFLRETHNFTGKVKGKILITENIRQNTVHARQDRVFCEYQSVGNDILENRILRAALERSAKVISEFASEGGKELPVLQQWVRESRAALHGVSVSHIHPSDFSFARKRGTFAFYRRPIQMAKAVLSQLGFNPREEIAEHQTRTPPFALDSAELFERYAQMKLLDEFPNLQAGYGRHNIFSRNEERFNVFVRPDFHVPLGSDDSPPHIIDAKYKKITGKKKIKPEQDDMYQVVAYSRHLRVLQEIGVSREESGERIQLSLAYPFLEGESPPAWSTRAFASNLKVRMIKCPRKDKLNSELPND